ncbi:MAG TPA: hypothetical protein VM688_03595 [Nocardioidaceae bacterium]|nr:hypothetical protein [Nocardioidaceae bacterium]
MRGHLTQSAGDRVKTDARDALHLARLLADAGDRDLDDLTQEAARDLEESAAT